MIATTTSALRQAARTASRGRCVSSWSGQLSFASPESDHVGRPLSTASSAHLADKPEFMSYGWSHRMSFASPESDFVAANVADGVEDTSPVWSETFSFASPESDFVGADVAEANVAEATPNTTPVWSESLSFASPESDWSAAMTRPALLPKTFADALRLEDAAVVITTAAAPHKIVHVNAAWEDLCGYSKKAALHQTLSLIQGPDTQDAVARDMVKTVLDTGGPVEGVLINYNKEHQPFVNHLTMGPLDWQDNDAQMLVGILRKVGLPTVAM